MVTSKHFTWFALALIGSGIAKIMSIREKLPSEAIITIVLLLLAFGILFYHNYDKEKIKTNEIKRGLGYLVLFMGFSLLANNYSSIKQYINTLF